MMNTIYNCYAKQKGPGLQWKKKKPARGLINLNPSGSFRAVDIK